MGKKKFTLICCACIFEQAFGKTDVFASVFACVFLDIVDIFLDNLLIHRFKFEFIQSWLFCPILNSNKPYYQPCKRMSCKRTVIFFAVSFVVSFAALMCLGLVCFDGWDSLLTGLIPGPFKTKPLTSLPLELGTPFNPSPSESNHVNQTCFQI
jgi:hypothetical protein